MNRFEHSFRSLLEFHGMWETDFDTGRRFIKKMNIRYWECGRVDLTHSLEGAPHQREQLARKRGLHVHSSNEKLPFELFTVTGEKVLKAWLSSCQLLFDTHAGVAVCCESDWKVARNTNVVWLSDMAFPIPALPIECTQPDRKAENRLWKEVFDVRWHEAQVLKELGELPHAPRNGGCDDADLWNPESRDADVIKFLATFENKQPFIDRYIKPRTNVVHKVEFLRFKRTDGN